MKQKIVNLLAGILPDFCPFATDIKWQGYQIVYIPPLCKINPLFNDIMKEKLRRLGY